MYSHLFRFLHVGAAGFAIDAGMLWFLVYQLDMPPILARVGSFVTTICVTFVFNAIYTFNVNIRSASMSRYIMIQIVGAAINFASYSWFVLYGPLASRPLLSLIVGSALSSAHNFIMMRHFVFGEATKNRR